MSQRQHTVPRSYLRAFSDPKGQLRAFDREGQRQLTLSANDASVVADIYRLPDAPAGVDPLVVESLLSEKEAAVAPLIRRIRMAQGGIDPGSIPILAEFIALQLVRTRRQWQQIQEMGDWYGKMWFEGLSREDVIKRFRDKGIEPSDESVDAVMRLVEHPEMFRIVPPKGTFLSLFLSTSMKLLPYLIEGWNWIVVRSGGRAFVTSDSPVVLVGDSVDGGLGLANAEELWLPVGRHHAVVLTRDFSLPAILLDLPSDHTRRICQRLALEANRWVYWHPNDRALQGLEVPRREKTLRFETVGWRKRTNDTVGEIVRVGPSRPVIAGERLLSGRLVVDRKAVFPDLVGRDEAFAQLSEESAAD